MPGCHWHQGKRRGTLYHEPPHHGATGLVRVTTVNRTGSVLQMRGSSGSRAAVPPWAPHRGTTVGRSSAAIGRVTLCTPHRSSMGKLGSEHWLHPIPPSRALWKMQISKVPGRAENDTPKTLSALSAGAPLHPIPLFCCSPYFPHPYTLPIHSASPPTHSSPK